MNGNEQAYPGFGASNTSGIREDRPIPGMTKREVMAMTLYAGLLSNRGMIDTFGGSALEVIAKQAVIATDVLFEVLSD